MNTLLLDPDTWDLLLDADANIAMATNPYSQSQDVSSACKLFKGELWYDISQGVPYFEDILGHTPPLQLIKQSYVTAAKTVPTIVAAVCYISDIKGRALSGQVQSTDTAGVLIASGF